MIFDSANGSANAFGVTMDTPVCITTQKWRAITFTASVLIWKRDAAGGGQPTPGMMGLAGARHPARMCKDMHEVKISVSAAAGTAGANADVNYMLVPWPEMCDADAHRHIAAEAQLAGAVVSQQDSQLDSQQAAVASTPVNSTAPPSFEGSTSAVKQTKKHSKGKKRRKKKDRESRSKSKKHRKLSHRLSTGVQDTDPKGVPSQHGSSHTAVVSTPVNATASSCFAPSISATKQTKKYRKGKKKSKKGFI